MKRLAAVLLLLGCGGPEPKAFGVTSSSSSSTAASSGGASTSSGNTGGESPNGGTGGEAGSGGTAECSIPEQCPGHDGECSWRTCLDGDCGVHVEPEGTPLYEQVDGDCKVTACGGAETIQLIDEGDLPDDGNECTDDSCTGSEPTHKPKPNGVDCTQNGGLYCVAGVCSA